MNYYEELGIRASAEAEEIRRAHRRLMKLMHPDRQHDPHMKRIAETQMRRLNTIVSILLNADQRREYDKGLNIGHEAHSSFGKVWRGVPLWLVGVVIAGILSIGGVWIFVEHLGKASAKPLTIPPQEAVSVAPPSTVPVDQQK